jgi:6-phosphogluconate dehydrogenase
MNVGDKVSKFNALLKADATVSGPEISDAIKEYDKIEDIIENMKKDRPEIVVLDNNGEKIDVSLNLLDNISIDN